MWLKVACFGARQHEALDELQCIHTDVDSLISGSVDVDLADLRRTNTSFLLAGPPPQHNFRLHMDRHHLRMPLTRRLQTMAGL